MTYSVREIFDTLQGEGARSGSRAVFVRFAGCNLWNGRAEDRATGRGECARWCDTDFARGVRMQAEEIVERADALWPLPAGAAARHLERWVVITGGEPALQLDHQLVARLRDAGFRIAVESNGTRANDAFASVDHLTVSPKLGPDHLVVFRAAELRVVVPGVAAPPAGVRVLQPGWTLDMLRALHASGTWGAAFLSPQDDGGGPATHARRAVDLVRELGAPWRVSVQLHKVLGLP